MPYPTDLAGKPLSGEALEEYRRGVREMLALNAKAAMSCAIRGDADAAEQILKGGYRIAVRGTAT